MFLGESAQLPEEGVSSEPPLSTHPELVTDSRGRNGASMSQCEAYFSESPEQESPSAKLAERKRSTGISSAVRTRVPGFQVYCEFNILSHCPHQSSRMARAGVLVFSLEIMPRFHSSDNYQELSCAGSGFGLSFGFSVSDMTGIWKVGEPGKS